MLQFSSKTSNRNAFYKAGELCDHDFGQGGLPTTLLRLRVCVLVGTQKRSCKVKKARFLCENGHSGDAQLPDKGRRKSEPQAGFSFAGRNQAQATELQKVLSPH
jgi:hypothetical protein